MFFILNAVWVALVLISGFLFTSGNKGGGMIFLGLGIVGGIFVYVLYARRRGDFNNLDCFMFDCGLDALGDCSHLGDCKHTGDCGHVGDCGHMVDCADIGACDCTP